jgi:FixJ family two-component response regulator
MAAFPVLDGNQFWAQGGPPDVNSLGNSSPNGERVARVALPLVSIVDDDDSVRKSLRRLLKSAGLRVQAFASAEDFLEFGNQFETACLVLDVRLTGMSGLDLQQQLASENSQIPIIFVSAHDEREARAEAMQAGAIAFLGKPFNDKTLLDVVHSALK